MSCVFEHLDACLPVTAIRVLDTPHGRLIISGQGPYLLLVDEASGALLDRVQLFERNNVHGIQIADINPTSPTAYIANFLAWGGQSFRLFSLKADRPGSGSLSLASSECAAPDWILDANFARSEDSGSNSNIVNRACLITAHNVLFALELKNDFATYEENVQLHQIGTGLKSVLYSADVLWLSSGQIIVAAGSVFGEIVVWSCFLSTVTGLTSFKDSSVSIHHLFTGHEGSIFGVNISPEVRWPNENQPRRFLASCSDDRTIRIWDISDFSSLATNGKNEALSIRPATRSTGFGNISSDELGMDREACIAKAWGHASRIWSACFVDMTISVQEAFFKLVSRGEDATCQVWELSLQHNLSTEEHPISYKNAKLQNISTYAYHSGKNIWSMAAHKSSDSTIIYSGGADGSIIAFCTGTSEGAYRYGTRTETYDIHDLSLCQHSASSSLISPTRKQKSGDKLNRYAFVSKTCILGLTSHGKLSLASVSDLSTDKSSQFDQYQAASVSWNILTSLDTPGSQFALASHPELGVAIIGDVKGTIWWYQHDNRTISNFTQLEKKITAILFADTNIKYGQNRGPVASVALVTTSVETPNTNLFLVSDINSPQHFRKITLDLPSSFLATSALFIENKSCLILGSKTGHLAVFDLEEDTGSQPRAALFTFFNLHARDSVTSITRLQQSNYEEERILTTGRDGHYCVHAMTTAGTPASPVTFRTIHKMAPPFGPYIEGAYFDKDTEDLILFGFRSTEFIVWNESAQSERAAIECGGAHRIWAYNPYHADDKHDTFAWTKASTFNLFRKSASLHRAVRLGNHGREIKVTAISEVPFDCGENKFKIIATGGEDTMIRISVLDEGSATTPSGSLRCLRNLKKHNAGIQHLQWSPCGNILFSSAGAEEFYVWRLRSIPGFGMGTVCEAECPKVTADSDLRITSFDVLKISTETEAEDSFLLSLAYSNSTVKIFHYVSSPSGCSFKTLAKGQYRTNCLTQVNFCSSGPRLSLITASTDGHIATWDISESLDDIFSLANGNLSSLPGSEMPMEPCTITWQHQHRMHQSSIKVMEISPLSQGERLIVAGGDDNAISVSRLKIGACIESDCSSSNLFTTVSLPQAHASAVTAISILGERVRQASGEQQLPISEFLFASSGNDQRLKLWSVGVDWTKAGEDGISLSLLQDAYTAVADMSSIGAFKGHIDDRGTNKRVSLKDRLVLCGVGIDLWSLNRE
ncbi:hypothetical protein AJ79_03547 [Helicocarpus griseus UAMH5409]|uniref:Uncharacterized protein n=1 Tax=Helicocarpus griseus UAMH5409 TaxID=1447875 RepID=A0A2B7XP55_9EURO|nr:hypothetical protein AJ79_03547 [Helicocarpus griseus UAMH5409]